MTNCTRTTLSLLSLSVAACGADLDLPPDLGPGDMSGPDAQTSPDAGVAPDAGAAPDSGMAQGPTWRPMAPSPLGPRFGAKSVWTGSELIVLCGFDAQDAPTCTSGRYDPAANQWSTMTIPADFVGPSSDEGHGVLSAVWTGTQVFVAGPDYAGLYDPVTDAWTKVDPGPTRGRFAPGLAWTGSAVFAFAEGGALFDPSTGLWTATATAGQPSPRSQPITAWTGSQVLVWGGNAQNDDGRLLSGGRYDPRTDTWSPMETAGSVDASVTFGAHVWTGSELLLWGTESSPSPTPPGAAYDPARNTWRALSSSGAPVNRGTLGYAWTGAALLVWGGWDPQMRFERKATGALYDPVGDQWRVLPMTAQTPAPRSGFAYAWTGTEFIVWGGAGNQVPAFGDGAALSF